MRSVLPMRPTPIAALLAAGLIAPACSSPDRAATPVAPSAKQAEHQPPEPVPEVKAPPIDDGVTTTKGQPLRLPTTAAKAAPWLEEPRTGKPKLFTDKFEAVAHGARGSVVRNVYGAHFGFHADTGAIGTLAIPSDAAWVGFGTDDELMYVDPAGQIFAAKSVAEARAAGNWKRRGGKTPGATDWDAGPGVLAATDGAKVWFSTDGGASFEESAPKVKGAIKSVFVRSGPVVVLAVPGKKNKIVPWVSTDGKTFKRSRLRLATLTRTGPWIWNGSWDCPAALARDGKTWMRPSPPMVHEAFNTSSWMAPLQTTTRLDGYNREPDWATPSHPSVPGHALSPIRGADPCPRAEEGGAPGGVEGGVMGGVLGGLSGGETCRGAECLRSDDAPVLPNARTNFLMLRDAFCQGAGRWAWSCKRTLQPKRMPHVVVADATDASVSFGELPPGCLPSEIHSARGLGVLLCRKPKATDVWVATKSTPWTREHTIERDAEQVWNLSVAADGTLLAQLSCPPQAVRCSAAVRRPVAPGTKGAWYEVTDVGAMTHRAVVGGRVLIASDAGGAIALSLAQGSDRRKAIMKPIDFKRPVKSLRVDDEGRVQVRIGGEVRGTVDAFFLGADGQQHKSEWPKPKRSKDGYLIAKPVPFDPTHR